MIRKIGNICLVGTSHISRKSIEEINNSYADFNPDGIAIELDIDRLNSLISKEERKIGIKDIFRIGIFSYLFVIIAKSMSKRLGKIINTEPGIDMLEGFKIAKRDNKELLLIDRHINITLHRLNSISLKHKIMMIFRTLTFSRKKLKRYKLDNIDFNDSPDEEFAMNAIIFIRNNYPEMYRILIEERNRIMANALINYSRDKKVLAIMGAGHVEGVMELIRISKSNEPQKI